MCARDLKPSAVSDEPYIHTGRDSQQRQGDEGKLIDKDLRGNIGVHGFWKTGQSTIFDIRITDIDCASWRDRDPHKVLAQHEKEKKKTYSAACTDRRRHFTPLVFSCDGMIAAEASAAIKRVASLLSQKWHRSYSETCAYVRSRISLVRAASHCLRGSRDPSARVSHATWETGTGMGLYR
jgi:IS1 family transposase